MRFAIIEQIIKFSENSDFFFIQIIGLLVEHFLTYKSWYRALNYDSKSHYLYQKGGVNKKKASTGY